jgi:hypothetical protein
MASLKRKREYIGGGGDDDDDDAIYGLRQTLPVANLPIDFDGEPMDGLQYLFTVRYVPSTLIETFKDRIISHPQARCTETTWHHARRQSLRPQPTTACSICHRRPTIHRTTPRGTLSIPKQRMA